MLLGQGEQLAFTTALPLMVQLISRVVIKHEAGLKVGYEEY